MLNLAARSRRCVASKRSALPISKRCPSGWQCVRGWMARRSCSSNASARSLPTRSRWSPTAPKHSWRTWSDHCSHTATTKRASSCAKSSSYPQICSPTTREERSPCACTAWPRRDTIASSLRCAAFSTTWPYVITQAPNSGWFSRPSSRRQSRDNYWRLSGALHWAGFPSTWPASWRKG